MCLIKIFCRYLVNLTLPLISVVQLLKILVLLDGILFLKNSYFIITLTHPTIDKACYIHYCVFCNVLLFYYAIVVIFTAHCASNFIFL